MVTAATRMSLVFIALSVLIGAASADFQLLDLVNSHGELLGRAKRQTADDDAKEPNVVQCVNPCDTTGDPNATATPPATDVTGDGAGPTATPPVGDGDGDREPTTTTHGDDDHPDVTATTPPANAITPDSFTSTPTDGSDECGCVSDEFNRRMSFLFMLLNNLDRGASYTFSIAIHDALDRRNVDELSASVRVILGMQPGDLMNALSCFQEQMSRQLVRHVRITIDLKRVLDGRVSTSTGILALHSRFAPSRKINQNNAILIVVSGMLCVHPALSGLSDDALHARLQQQMPVRDETTFFLNVDTIVSSLQLGVPNDVASRKIYETIRTVTVQVWFAHPVQLNEKTKDCDDSEDESDASDDADKHDGDSNEGGEQGVDKGDSDDDSDESDESGDKHHKHSKEDSKHRKSHEHKSHEHGSKEHKSKEHKSKEDRDRHRSHEDRKGKSKVVSKAKPKAKHPAAKSKPNTKMNTKQHEAKSKAHSKSKSVSHANNKA